MLKETLGECRGRGNMKKTEMCRFTFFQSTTVTKVY